MGFPAWIVSVFLSGPFIVQPKMVLTVSRPFSCFFMSFHGSRAFGTLPTISKPMAASIQGILTSLRGAHWFTSSWVGMFSFCIGILFWVNTLEVLHIHYFLDHIFPSPMLQIRSISAFHLRSWSWGSPIPICLLVSNMQHSWVFQSILASSKIMFSLAIHASVCWRFVTMS